MLCTCTVYWYCVLCKKHWKPVVLLCLFAFRTQKSEYSIGNMNVLKTTKSNRVFHNNENINETGVILTFWSKTLIIHYKNWCFWQSMNTQAWHVFHTNEFAYKTWCFLMNWCKMLILHWKFICFVIKARTLETKMSFPLGPYCKKSSKSLKKPLVL